MNKVCILALVSMFACAGAYAADDKAAAKPNAQQSKMATCQAEAGAKKLESTARQDYVNNCLKAKPAVAEKPKSKMAECNAKTKGMTKDEANKERAACMKT